MYYSKVPPHRPLIIKATLTIKTTSLRTEMMFSIEVGLINKTYSLIKTTFDKYRWWSYQQDVTVPVFFLGVWFP